MLKIGIVSPYFDIFGGGERYMLTAADFFLRRGDSVTIFWKKGVDPNIIDQKFGIKLFGAKFADSPFGVGGNFLRRILTTAKYDLMFFLSDGSIPNSFAKKTILHFQYPFDHFDKNSPINKLKLSRIDTIICNSDFTKNSIDKAYRVNSVVVYPPVDVASFPRVKKENVILSVGRFFAPSHSKKQEVLIDTFKDLAKGSLSNWRLVLIGSVSPEHQRLIPKLTKLATNHPIDFIINPNFPQLRKFYSRAKIYWHATGYGENLQDNPGRSEHFGITTVEAMAAGAVPVVFSAGGQKEIIQHGINGFLWESIAGLKKATLQLVKNDKYRNDIAKKAILHAQKFSVENFFHNLQKII